MSSSSTPPAIENKMIYPDEVSFLASFVPGEKLVRYRGEASQKNQPFEKGTCPSTTGPWKRFIAVNRKRAVKGKKSATWETIIKFISSCKDWPYIFVEAVCSITEETSTGKTVRLVNKTIFYRRLLPNI